MQLTQPEVKAIAAAFRNPEALRTSGVYLGGIKYLYLQSDEAQIQAKKGSAGVAIAKSNKCMSQSLSSFAVFPDIISLSVTLNWLYKL